MKLGCTSLFFSAATLLLLSGCDRQRSIHTAPDESRPHLTWEIRAGSRYGGEQFVCGSAKPNPVCTLPASQGSGSPGRTFVTVYIDVHPAARQTNYVGTWRATFLQGWTEKDSREVSGAVDPKDAPLRVSVSGIVTDQSGSYNLSARLEAAEAGIPSASPVNLDVPVTVTRSEPTGR